MQETQTNQIVEFLEKATLLAATLESRCEQAADQLDGGARALEEALQRVEHDIGTIVGNGRDELARQVQAAVRQALVQEVGMATAALGESVAQVRQASEQLRREQTIVAGRMRMMGWKSMAAVGAAALLVLAGTGFVAWNNVQRIQATNVRAEVLEALAHVNVTSCDGRPCIRLAEGQSRWPRNHDYILVGVTDPGGTPASAPAPAR